jgi:hypothetical protein
MRMMRMMMMTTTMTTTTMIWRKKRDGVMIQMDRGTACHTSHITRHAPCCSRG